MNKKADKWAPLTLKRGDDLIARTDEILEADRYRGEDARGLAASATEGIPSRRVDL